MVCPFILTEPLYDHGHFCNNLFMMNLECMPESHKYLVNITSSSNDVASESIKWHARLGHIGHDRMSRLAREELLGSLIKMNLPTCEPCLVGKATKSLLVRLRGLLIL